MEPSVVFLQYLLVLLLANYVTSSSTNCICKFPTDFCKPNITAVQGKVLGSQLANETGDLVSDRSMAHKTRYRVERTQEMIKGSHELQLMNNTFKISVRLDDPCHFNFTNGRSYVFLGKVNDNGRWSRLDCILDVPLRGSGKGSGGDLEIKGDDMIYSELCKKS